MREPNVSKVLRFMLYVIFVFGVAVMATLPFMIDKYGALLYDAYFYERGYRTFILTFLMILGVFGIWIVGELIGIMHTVRVDPFIKKNVSALRRIGILAVCVATLFAVKCVLFVTFLTVVCVFLFIICGMLAFTLCSLFKQAVAFKEENDLTI